jgi:hypothetical protein
MKCSVDHLDTSKLHTLYAHDWFNDSASWDGATVYISGEWTINAATSDADLNKIARSMQDDANEYGVTLRRIDSYLSDLRDEAIEKSEEA